MSIVVLKLINGDEVIAKLVDGKYAKPRVFQMIPTERGMSGALMPYIMSCPEETVDIASFAIVTTVEASKQIEDAYLQQTSGIDLSSKLS